MAFDSLAAIEIVAGARVCQPQLVRRPAALEKI